MSNVLFFCDAHVHPGEDLWRFTALGRMIAEFQPKVIVQGGDFVSLDSLSHFDRYRARLKEGRRYALEVAAANQAISAMWEPVEKLQDQQRAKKKGVYKPHLVWIEGNHEHRVSKYVDEFPEVEFLMDLKRQLIFPENGVEQVTWVPWKQTVFIGGVGFTHAIIGPNGPISSKYICARALAEVYDVSVVFGHHHFRQEYSINKRTSEGLRTLRAVCGGCFLENDPQYVEGNTHNWWKGLTIFDIFAPGQFDMAEISLEKLRRDFMPNETDQEPEENVESE